MEEIQFGWKKGENTQISEKPSHVQLSGELIQYNVHITQSHLEIQCNLYQDSDAIFMQLENHILKFIWNHKKTPCSQRKKEQNRRHPPSWFQASF